VYIFKKKCLKLPDEQDDDKIPEISRKATILFTQGMEGAFFPE
jgi:hypothetical protein